MRVLKDWTCDFIIDTDNPLTVGQKFVALCHGSKSISVDSKVSLKTAKEGDEYKVVLNEYKFKSNQELFLSLTSWSVGDNRVDGLKIEIGDSYIITNAPKFKVTSTLQKDTKMNPPPGPLLVKLPMSFWVTVSILGLSLVVALVHAYRKARDYDRGMLKLNSLKTSLSPFYEFQKQARIIKKQVEVNLSKDELNKQIISLYKNLVTFVSLELDAPLFIYSEKQVKKKFLQKKFGLNFIKEYFYLTSELKKVSNQLKTAENPEGFKDDLENLVFESITYSQKFNKHKIGESHV